MNYDSMSFFQILSLTILFFIVLLMIFMAKNTKGLL